MYAKTNDSKLLQEVQKNNDNIINTETEYLNDYNKISNRIEKLSRIIEKLKKEEYLIFKEKIKLMKDEERKKNFVLIYKALFGNIIFDTESKYQTVFIKY